MPQQPIVLDQNVPVTKPTYDPATNRWILPQSSGQATPSLLAQPPSGLSGKSPIVDKMPDQLRILSMILGLVPAVGPMKGLTSGAGTLGRMGVQALLGGAAGGLEGGPLAGAEEGLINGISEGSGWAGDKVQRGATNVGLRIGGVRGDIDHALDAFQRQSRTSSGGSALGGIIRRDVTPQSLWDRVKSADILPTIHPGQRSKTTRRISDQSQKLANIETSTPGTRNILGALTGFNDESRVRAQSGSVNPTSTSEALRDSENAQIEEQITNALGLPRSSTRYGDPSFPVYLNSAHHAEMNTRAFGNAKRDASHTAKGLIDIRKSGPGNSYVPAEKMLEMQSAANFGNRARETQMDLANAAGTGKELEATNQNLSDLFTINSVNEMLRGGGGVITDLGQFGMRGGLGAGVAANISPQLRGPLATAFMLLANPKGISRAGGALKGGITFTKHKRRWDKIAGEDEQ